MAKMEAKSITITMQPTENPNTYGATPSEDHERAAANHETKRREQERALWARIEALRTLFGRGLSAALEEHAEMAAEHASEEAWHLRQRLHEITVQRQEQTRRELRLVALLQRAVAHETDPRRRRKHEPEWIADARQLIEEPF